MMSYCGQRQKPKKLMKKLLKSTHREIVFTRLRSNTIPSHLTASTSSSIYSELEGATMASMRTASMVSPALVCDALLDLDQINFWTAGTKFWILTMGIQEYSLYRMGNETHDRYLSLFSIFKNWCISVGKIRLKLKDSCTGAKPHKKCQCDIVL